MAVREAVGSTLQDYISEVRSIWGDGKSPDLPFRVKALMEKLFAGTGPDTPWMAQLIREAKPGVELYRDLDYGFIQMGHVHPKDHRNLPHDHGPCWVVYGAYSGLTEITLYRRTDDGKEPGKAALEVKEVHRLSAGVVYPYLRGDIHSTRAVEAPAVVFRFLSCDLEKVKRNRYDPAKGIVREI